MKKDFMRVTSMTGSSDRDHRKSRRLPRPTEQSRLPGVVTVNSNYS